MINSKHKQNFSFIILVTVTVLLSGCAQYGMISENDVYMQKPTALSAGEDESDLTSYNAYKARQRGVYQDEYLIDQMYDRRYYGTLLYGGAPMFGMPFYPGNFITWGYQSPIRGYQNTFYFNSFYNWNRPWTYGYGYNYNPYNPYANGFYGYSYPNYSPFGNPFGYGNYGSGVNLSANNNYGSQGNHYSGHKRFSLSSSASRSSSYPGTLKSNTEVYSNSSSFDGTNEMKTSRRAAAKKSIRSSHMPFRNNSSYYQGNEQQQNSLSQNQRTNSRSVNTNRNINRTTRSTYKPSRSAQRSGIARTPRATNYERTNYSSSSNRRTSSPGSSRGGSYNTRMRSTGSSSGTTRTTTSSSSSSRSSRSSSSSSSGRR